jgi:serine/threonine protein kinase
VADTPLGPATVLAGRFVLEDLLDESDEARFWRATDRVLARSVAVHVLPADDPRASQLLDAARASALVTDGHLLRVLDAAAADGVVYVVNEWGSGVTLDRLVAEGPLSPRRAAWVVKEVAGAIRTAHSNGVAHGRLLPENVMVSEAGSVKLIGFAVDAVLRSPSGRRTVTDDRPVTAQESDVVNLAALLYAALVGRWPGTEGSTVPVAPTEHGRALRPRRVRAGIPRPLDAICEQVLNPESHPQALPIDTAHEIHAALSDFIGDPGGSSSWGFQPTQEPTAVLDRDDLEPGEDPEATQAGTPVFLEQDGTGWMPAGPVHPDPPSPPTQAQPTHPQPAPDVPDRSGGVNNQPSTTAWRPLFHDDPPTETTRSTPQDAAPTDATPQAGPQSAGSGPRSRRSAAGSPAASTEGPPTGEQRSTGAGNGTVPPVWGPDADHDPSTDDRGWASDGQGDGARPGRTWLRLAVVVAVVLLVAVGTVLALNLGRDSSGRSGVAQPSQSPSGSGTPSGAPVPISAVSDFDPLADPPEENPGLARLAIDGKPGTAWHTVTYRGNPRLGGLKSGVGLLVDLGKRTTVGEVRLRLDGSPTSLDILAAPRAGSAPSSTDGLTTVGSAKDAGTDVRVALRSRVTTRWLVVWLTSLPPAPGGYQGRIAEISARS